MLEHREERLLEGDAHGDCPGARRQRQAQLYLCRRDAVFCRHDPPLRDRRLRGHLLQARRTVAKVRRTSEGTQRVM